MNLDDLIESGIESTNLDFKYKEYSREKKEDLLKDIMSMANAPSTEKKRIIIGVKLNMDGTRDKEGLITLSDVVDFENLVQENIEPTINFNYFSHEYEGKKFGILEVFDNFDLPYMMRKNFKRLKAGDMWIREGTRQSRVLRRNLDEMCRYKEENRFRDKVSIGYGEELKQSFNITRTCFNEEDLPSEKNKQFLIESRKKLEEIKQKIDTNEINSGIILQSVGMLSPYNHLNRSISIASDDITGLPIYKNEEELDILIDNVDKEYREEDEFYLYEELSDKINFYIKNNSNFHLKDITIKLYFDSDIFRLSTKRHKKGKIKYKAEDIKISEQPYIYEEKASIVVEQKHGLVKKNNCKKIFSEDLRILVVASRDINKSKIKYKIKSDDLLNEINGDIDVNIK